MTFPVVESNAPTSDTSSASVTVTMPSGIAAGDLLMCFWSQDANGTVTQSGGSDWTDIDQGAGSGSACRGGCFAKIASGGDTLTLASTNSQDFACVTVRISNHDVSNVATDIAKGTAATGSDAAPNPPSVSFTDGDTLIIETFASDDDDDTATYWSSGYTGIAQRESASSTSSTLVGVARLNATTSPQNPGAMALAAVEEWRAQTFAIPGSEAVINNVDVSTAALTITPHDVALNVIRAVAVTPASLVITTYDVALNVIRAVAVTPASLVITTYDVELIRSYQLDVTPATLTITTYAVELNVIRAVAVTPAALTITTYDVGLNVSFFVDVTTAQLTITSYDVELTPLRSIAVVTRALTITGHNVTFELDIGLHIDAEHSPRCVRVCLRRLRRLARLRALLANVPTPRRKFKRRYKPLGLNVTW